ncbi:MAG TPA: lipopolysaccharide kinase InaA family protein [Planctomycetota bacterium]|jgi:tRNA A-37 threonylcarbamoyl transferase component Bud32|nr:lipopolysaccharide kinase InaA family protein [Planctomycetota bacterium]
MPRVAEFAPALPPAAREALLALLRSRSEILKDSVRGEVRRVSTPALPHPLVVKRYPPRGLFRTAVRGLRGSAARREFRAAQRLAAEGVAAVRALAFVEERSGPLLGDSFVVLEDLGSAPTLAQALRGTAPLERRRLLESAGSLAADLHAAGFVHGDLHAGNFFVRPDGSLAVGDLARSRPRAPTLRARCADLAFLLHSLRALGGFERARSLRAYAARARLPFRRIARVALRGATRRARSRSLGAARGAAEARYGRTAALPRGWKGISYGARAKALEHALAAAARDGSAEGSEGLRIRRLRRGDAERAFGDLHRCAALGLPTPDPVGWFEREEGGDSFLVVEIAHPGPPLPEALAQAHGQARAALLSSLGRLARRAHDGGLRFGAVPCEALLVDAEGRPLLVWTLGLEARPRRSVGARRADLEAFATPLGARLSRADRARVLRAYDPFGHLFPRGAGLRSA